MSISNGSSWAWQVATATDVRFLGVCYFDGKASATNLQRPCDTFVHSSGSGRVDNQRCKDPWIG